ncbi:hypothetical protein AX15_001354 [Amanita polypyramis BW_CC]|nr:hypothetical protein AX15_001354 [Amanita polypyramis BW_CC]
MSSHKGVSVRPKLSLKFYKFKSSFFETKSAISSVSDVSTLVATPLDDKKSFKASKDQICEEELLDWENQAWGYPQSAFSWSALFGCRKD